MKLNASIVLGALTIAASSPTIVAAPLPQDGSTNGASGGITSPEPNEALSPRARQPERFGGQNIAKKRASLIKGGKEKKDGESNNIGFTTRSSSEVSFTGQSSVERRQLPVPGLGLDSSTLTALGQQATSSLNGLGLNGLVSGASGQLSQAGGLVGSAGLSGLLGGSGVGLGLVGSLTGDLPLVGPLLGQVESLAGLQDIVGGASAGSTGATTASMNALGGLSRLVSPQVLEAQLVSDAAQTGPLLTSGTNEWNQTVAEDSAQQYWNAAAPVVNQLPVPLSSLAAQLNWAANTDTADVAGVVTSVLPSASAALPSASADPAANLRQRDAAATPSAVAEPAAQISSEVQSVVASIDSAIASATTATDTLQGNPLTYLKPPLTADPTQDNATPGLDAVPITVPADPAVPSAFLGSGSAAIVPLTSTAASPSAAVLPTSSANLSIVTPAAGVPTGVIARRDLPVTSTYEPQTSVQVDSVGSMSAVDQSLSSHLNPLAPAVAPLVKQYLANPSPPASPTPSSLAGSFHSVFSSLSFSHSVATLEHLSPTPSLQASASKDIAQRALATQSEVVPSTSVSWSQDLKHAEAAALSSVGLVPTGAIPFAVASKSTLPLPLQRFVRRKKEQHEGAVLSSKASSKSKSMQKAFDTASDPLISVAGVGILKRRGNKLVEVLSRFRSMRRTQ
ncbi:MAG: hypothetical protein CYPHOPRED_000149 [Cyphobasidiales sp. Tagirdzhanova-0007]|nr:MAG: hypothetical protein CYPHOPRED_000149 [Cyphobasidiales sp. Tagirdzhanova-0007]